MSKARNIADLLEADGEVKASRVDAHSLALAGGTMTGSLHMGNGAGITSTTANESLRVINPGGGARKNAANAETGAIRILIPSAATSPDGQGMFTFTVEVYEYANGQSFTAKISGHNSGSVWHGHTGYIIAGPLMAQDYAIRFGKTAAGQYCVYIGETNTSWSYPQIAVTEVSAGYNNATAADWDNGWDVDIVTSAFEGVTDTIVAGATMSSGKVLQVVTITDETQRSAVSAWNNAVDGSITLKGSNSKLVISGVAYLAPYTASINQDPTDLTVGFQVHGAWVGDMTGGISFGGHGFHTSDVPIWHSSNTHGGGYETRPYPAFISTDVSSLSSGTAVTCRLRFHCASYGGWANRSRQNGTSSKSMSSMTIMEVQL